MRDWDWLRPHTLNLYEYVGNDPVNMWDPTGYMINGKRLTEEQRQSVLQEFSTITGYNTGFQTDEEGNTQATGLYFDDDGYLQIAEGAVANSDGSTVAQDSLSAFIQDDLDVSLITADPRAPVQGEYFALATAIPDHLSPSPDPSRPMNATFIDFLDFSDKTNFVSKGVPEKAYGMGITLFHEFHHNFTGEGDPKNWQRVRDMGTVTGPAVDFANTIRGQLNLPLRAVYLPINHAGGWNEIFFKSPTTGQKVGSVLLNGRKMKPKPK